MFNTLNKLGCCCRRWKNKEEKYIIWIIFGLAICTSCHFVFFELYFSASFRCELLFIKCLLHHHCDCCAFIKQTKYFRHAYMYPSSIILTKWFKRILKFSSQVSIVILHTLFAERATTVYHSNLWHSRGAPVCLYIMYT